MCLSLSTQEPATHSLEAFDEHKPFWLSITLFPTPSHMSASVSSCMYWKGWKSRSLSPIPEGVHLGYRISFNEEKINEV